MVNYIQNYKIKKYSLFALISLFIAYLFYVTPIIYDDCFNKAHGSSYNTFLKDWHSSYQMYYSWSSRTFVNFVMYQMEVHSKLLFALVTALFFFLMLLSVSAIVNKNNILKLDVSIGFALMTVPLVYYSTAGWIATTATYLYPICAATYALTSLTERKSNFGKIGICLATFYASNNEQVLIVLLAIFAAFSVSEYWQKRRLCKLIIVQNFILGFNLLWFCLSPGNKKRALQEIPHWFPEFKNMNLLNKLDMGFMTTMQHILFANLPYMFLIVTIPVIFYLYRCYIGNSKEKPYLITSILTFVVWCLSSILFDVFNITGNKTLSRIFCFSKLGMFTSDNVNSKIAIFSFLIYFIFLALLLFNYSFEMESKKYFVLLAAFVGAVLSRIALGFSATNYVSATRTFSVMAVTLIIILLFMLDKMVKARYFYCINIIIIVATMANVFVLYLQVTSGDLRLVPLWISLLSA